MCMALIIPLWTRPLSGICQSSALVMFNREDNERLITVAQTELIRVEDVDCFVWGRIVSVVISACVLITCGWKPLILWLWCHLSPTPKSLNTAPFIIYSSESESDKMYALCMANCLWTPNHHAHICRPFTNWCQNDGSTLWYRKS